MEKKAVVNAPVGPQEGPGLDSDIGTPSGLEDSVLDNPVDRLIQPYDINQSIPDKEFLKNFKAPHKKRTITMDKKTVREMILRLAAEKEEAGGEKLSPGDIRLLKPEEFKLVRSLNDDTVRALAMLLEKVQIESKRAEAFAVDMKDTKAGESYPEIDKAYQELIKNYPELGSQNGAVGIIPRIEANDNKIQAYQHIEKRLIGMIETATSTKSVGEYLTGIYKTIVSNDITSPRDIEEGAISELKEHIAFIKEQHKNIGALEEEVARREKALDGFALVKRTKFAKLQLMTKELKAAAKIFVGQVKAAMQRSSGGGITKAKDIVPPPAPVAPGPEKGLQDAHDRALKGLGREPEPAAAPGGKSPIELMRKKFDKKKTSLEGGMVVEADAEVDFVSLAEALENEGAAWDEVNSVMASAADEIQGILGACDKFNEIAGSIAEHTQAIQSALTEPSAVEEEGVTEEDVPDVAREDDADSWLGKGKNWIEKNVLGPAQDLMSPGMEPVLAPVPASVGNAWSRKAEPSAEKEIEQYVAEGVALPDSKAALLSFPSEHDKTGGIWQVVESEDGKSKIVIKPLSSEEKLEAKINKVLTAKDEGDFKRDEPVCIDLGQIVETGHVEVYLGNDMYQVRCGTESVRVSSRNIYKNPSGLWR